MVSTRTGRRLAMAGLVVLAALVGLLTGGPVWAWAVGGLVLAVVAGVVVDLVIARRRGDWGEPGRYDVTLRLGRGPGAQRPGSDADDRPS